MISDQKPSNSVFCLKHLKPQTTDYVVNLFLLALKIWIWVHMKNFPYWLSHTDQTSNPFMRHGFSWTCNKSRKYITKSREMEQQVRIVNKKPVTQVCWRRMGKEMSMIKKSSKVGKKERIAKCETDRIVRNVMGMRKNYCKWKWTLQVILLPNFLFLRESVS